MAAKTTKAAARVPQTSGEISGTTQQTIAKGVSGIPIQAIKSAENIQVKEMDNRVQRAIQEQLTRRKKIQSNVDIIDIQQTQQSKRQRVVGETVQTFRETSAEIGHIIDRSFVERTKRKGGGINRTSVSVLTLAGLYPFMIEAGKAFDSKELTSMGDMYKTIWEEIMTQSEHLNKTARAGDLNYSVPPPPESQGVPEWLLPFLEGRDQQGPPAPEPEINTETQSEAVKAARASTEAILNPRLGAAADPRIQGQLDRLGDRFWDWVFQR